MAHPTSKALEHYLTQPGDTLRMLNVRIGSFRVEELVITGREAAIHAQEILNAAHERTRRSRVTKNGTRYPEPLPVGTPARLLSVEIADYLQDRDNRGLARDTVDATARTLTLLQMACGDIPVSRIDHAHIYRLWDLMRWSPPLLLSDPLYRNFTFEQAVARGKELCVEPPAPATFEKHRRFLSTFFKRLTKTKAIPASPMDAFDEVRRPPAFSSGAI